MLTEAYLQRFSGIGRLYGQHALSFFQQAHVCVIGIGGVGSWAAEALVRSGIGAITLIDMDDVCVSNTNRQLHTLTTTVGQSKSEVMGERLRFINPECRVTVIDDFVDAGNLSIYLSTQFDYVIDAIDSIKAKVALIVFCRRHKMPLIVSGGAGGQIDPTQIQLADLAKTIQDPLLAKVRERLKYEYGIQKNSKGKLGIQCVFSTEPLRYPQADGQACIGRGDVVGSMRMDCASGFGAVSTVTASFAFVAVSRVLTRLATKTSSS